MAVSTPVGTDTDLETIGQALEAVSRLLSQGRVVEQILRQAKVDVGRADDSVRLGDLADRLRVDAPTVTRRAQQLEARQLLRRASDPRDKRVSLVRLTPAGERIIARVHGARGAWLDRVLATWSDEERRQLGGLLARFVDDVGADLEGPDGH